MPALRAIGIVLVCVALDFGISVSAEPDKDSVLRMLKTFEQKFTYVDVRFRGYEIYPAGSLTADVIEAMMEEQEEDENAVSIQELGQNFTFPERDVRNEASVHWRADFGKERSVIEERLSVFDVSDRTFSIGVYRSYCLNDIKEFWLEKPLRENPKSAFPIKKNTPEYFVYDRAGRDGLHGDALATALFASVGRFSFDGRNPFADPIFSSDLVTSVTRIGANQLELTAMDKYGSRCELVCQLDDEVARPISYRKFSGIRPLIEITFDYGEQAIADRISYAYFWGGELSKQGVLNVESIFYDDISSAQEIGPLVVPVGKVLHSQGKYFYIASDQSRVEFNPFLPRAGSGNVFSMIEIVILTVFVALIAFWLFLRFKGS